MSKKLGDNITVKANGVDNCGTITGNNYYAEIHDDIKSGVDTGTPYTRNWGVFYNLNYEEENMMNLYEVYIIDTETDEFFMMQVATKKEYTAINKAWETSHFYDDENNSKTLDDYKVETRVICSWPKKE